MVIVMPTRSDLRDEFDMADDVFALSPISASPAQPSEADYEAIRDAFMETSRGRWFLGEYAKRNRNADTSMVLDAVARIEQALAAQQRLQQQHEIQAAEQSALPEALASIRNAVTGAEAAAATALDGLALEQNLTPIRKGLRIIREISWRWREIGADSRICDLIDSQVVAIEATCDQLVGADPRAALIAAFDMIRAELDIHDEATAAAAPLASDDIETSAPEMSAAETRPAAEVPAPETPRAPVDGEPVRPAQGAAVQVEAPVVAPAPPAPAPKLEAAVPVERVAAAPARPAPEVAATRVPVADDIVAEAPVPPAPSKAFETMPGPVQALVEPPKPAVAPVQVMGERPKVMDEFALSVTDDDDLDIIVVSKAEADAQDEALLELVAAEMGAPDPVEAKEFNTSSSIHLDIEDPGAVDDDIVATFAEPPASKPEPEQPRAAAIAAPSTAPAPQAPAPQPRVSPQAIAWAPDPRAVPPAAAPVPEPVVLPPAPAAPMPAPVAQAPAVVMQVPAKAAPVVQEQPRPAPIVAAPIVAEQPKPVPVVQEQLRPAAPTAMVHPLPKPIPQPSLGATLLANGLLQRPVAANDPLTPIRRMTQPEKIAFFS
jgi:hypothetical protein